MPTSPGQTALMRGLPLKMKRARDLFPIPPGKQRAQPQVGGWTSVKRKAGGGILRCSSLQGGEPMLRVGLLVRLRAKADKEAEVAKFLEGALAAAQAEAHPGLVRDPGGQGRVRDFRRVPRRGRPAGASRRSDRGGAHEAGRELLAEPPRIERVDVLAAK